LACRRWAEVGFEPCYSQNPLVTIWLSGLLKRRFVFAKARESAPGHLRRREDGRDGIHGASLLASAEFTEDRSRSGRTCRSAIPSWKLLLEACLEAMADGASLRFKIWAGGTDLLDTEMASRGGTGLNRSGGNSAARSRHDA